MSQFDTIQVLIQISQAVLLVYFGLLVDLYSNYVIFLYEIPKVLVNKG